MGRVVTGTRQRAVLEGGWAGLLLDLGVAMEYILHSTWASTLVVKMQLLFNSGTKIT